jgi:hypothetical protein
MTYLAKYDMIGVSQTKGYYTNGRADKNDVTIAGRKATGIVSCEAYFPLLLSVRAGYSSSNFDFLAFFAFRYRGAYSAVIFF